MPTNIAPGVAEASESRFLEGSKAVVAGQPRAILLLEPELKDMLGPPRPNGPKHAPPVIGVHFPFSFLFVLSLLLLAGPSSFLWLASSCSPVLPSILSLPFPNHSKFADRRLIPIFSRLPMSLLWSYPPHHDGSH